MIGFCWTVLALGIVILSGIIVSMILEYIRSISSSNTQSTVIKETVLPPSIGVQVSIDDLKQLTSSEPEYMVLFNSEGVIND